MIVILSFSNKLFYLVYALNPNYEVQHVFYKISTIIQNDKSYYLFKSQHDSNWPSAIESQ